MGLIRELQREQNIKSSPSKQTDTWITINFDIKVGLSLYVGLALLLIAIPVAFKGLTIWIIPEWGQTNLQTDLVRILLLGWLVVLPMFSGLFFVAMGLSDKNRKVVLSQTKLIFDPLFWREKIFVKYEQIEEVVWYYKRRYPGQVDRIGIAVHYHPFNSHQQIDTNKFYKLIITGVKNEADLLEELQKRITRTSPVDKVPVIPNSPNRLLLVAIVGGLFYCPILLLVLIRIVVP